MTPDPEPRKLLLATAGAALAAAVVLVTAVLPAEYGLDPTGIGHLAGFTRLRDPGPDPVADLDDGTATVHAIDARWRVKSIPVATREGFTAGPFGETRVKLPMNVTNLSKVTATLVWDDADRISGARTGPDTFELGIDGPGGRESQRVQAENGPDGKGEITVSLAWRSVPAPRRTTEGFLWPSEAPDNRSHGEWTFKVRLYAARGAADASEPDPGNNWSLSVTAQAYELAVEESEGFSGDRVTLSVLPNAGVEYKLGMHPGATLRYRWEATAPVYWDFHADEEGKDPEDFTRFEEGTSAGERGSLTAEFPGRYGWYFLNRGSRAVTVTLETAGDYTILGVV